ncbi:hypothetical protein PCH_Pc16g07200 [Penicillium rubens Wisconsin 54-1255]|uniref:Uncharacterized protein n=1 Tax=Penicillium rubens (strain ATCC 28089 / DSM 1075 / NRRL 1951 / Wisconsin 54-1255) TaxID=500485 RepID=B6H7D9_PENRW|nr:hypothetical protein PCH_Pc16g07200 [Penicillium rubens Wisconsin 54-1255]
MGGPDPYRNSRVKFLISLPSSAMRMSTWSSIISEGRLSTTQSRIDRGPLIINSCKMEGLPESPESNLSRLTRYFATRLEHFRLLEDLYRDMDLANVVADKEALQIKSSEYD